MSLLIQSLLLLIIGIVGVGTPLYFVFDFSPLTFWGIVITLGIASLYSVRYLRKSPPRPREQITVRHWLTLIVFVCLCTISFALLYSHRTYTSVLGPWAVIPPMFFTLFFLQSLVLFTGIFRGLPARIALGAISLHVLLALAIIPLTFPLGYGFDPVIHQQAEKIILEEGSLQPKTPYYTGQYVLFAFLARALSLPSESLDRYLLPLLAVLTVPFMAYHSLRLLGIQKAYALLGGLGVSMALVPTIASPTPWGWAALLFTILTFGSIRFFAAQDKYRSCLVLLLTVFAITLIHPLAGLPSLASAVVLVIIRFVPKPSRTLRRSLLSVSVLTGALLVPAAFLINAQISGLPLRIGIDLPQIPLSITQLAHLFPWRFDAVRDPLYAMASISPLLVLLLWIWGYRQSLDASSALIRSTAIASGVMCSMIFLGFVIMRYFLHFDFLIEYEQSDYAERLLTLLSIAMLPLALTSALRLLTQVGRASGHSTLRVVTVVLLATLSVGSLYLSYPRNDQYGSFHGYNLSAADIEAVELIHADAGDEAYIVLSNQVTAAAAIKKNGFLRYVNYATTQGDQKIFYYPVPTSSPLYKSFLAMMQKGDRAIIDDVMNRTGSSQAYFVVHNYEPRAPNIVKTAHRSADNAFSIENGVITVFRYTHR